MYQGEIPIIKNEGTNIYKVARGKKPMEKNIIVTDRTGKRLGFTYLKRAKGLVKNGRAEFISDREIKLLSDDFSLTSEDSQPDSTEVNKMSDINLNKDDSVSVLNEENNIYFNAREWSICSDPATSKGERTFVTDFENNLSESYCIGDKTQSVTEIGTKQLILNKNTQYMFYFWLKLDKNIKYDAVCQLQIIYNSDFENKRVYMLSNNNIRPIKATDGWRLYKIPFTTEENEYTQLRFSVKSAMCTIIPGKELKYYSELPDDYSFETVREESELEEEADNNDVKNAFENISNSFRDFFGKFDTSNKNQSADSTTDQGSDGNRTVKDPFTAFNDFAKQLKRDVQREVNKNIRNDIYTDIKAMKDDIVNEIKNTFNNNKNQ